MDFCAIHLARLIASGEVKVRDVVQQAFDRISKERAQNAWITLCEKEAFAQADFVQYCVDQGVFLSPLAGVPLAVNDNICTKNLETTCASKLLTTYQPPFDATVIEKLKAAGLVILGKTNLDEFAMGQTGQTSFFGPIRNPWDLTRVSGCGSAAAVASGHSFLALGTDSGGSIRKACAWCGLTGLKPTYGTISRYGLVAFASSLDQIGPIAGTAKDCAALFEIICGPDARDSTMISDMERPDKRLLQPDNLGGLKVGLPDHLWAHPLPPEVQQLTLPAIDLFKKLGADVVPCPIDLTEEALAAHAVIAAAEASSNLARFDGIRFGSRPDDMGSIDDITQYYECVRTSGFSREARRRILLGTLVQSADFYEDWYLKAQRIRRLIQERYLSLFKNFDVLITPVASIPAALSSGVYDDIQSGEQENVLTVAANLTGFPALSLPCGLTDDRLPVGLQLMGQPLSDRFLLQIGEVFQANTDFHRKHPDNLGQRWM